MVLLIFSFSSFIKILFHLVWQYKTCGDRHSGRILLFHHFACSLRNLAKRPPNDQIFSSLPVPYGRQYFQVPATSETQFKVHDYFSVIILCEIHEDVRCRTFLWDRLLYVVTMKLL